MGHKVDFSDYMFSKLESYNFKRRTRALIVLVLIPVFIIPAMLHERVTSKWVRHKYDLWGLIKICVFGLLKGGE